MASEDLINAGIFKAGGLIGLAGKSLFGKKKSPKINFAALQNILNQGIDRQRAEIQAGFAQTPQLSQQFKQTREALGRAFETGANQRAQQFAQDLQNVESPDFVRQQQAKARELSFRNLPAAQQAVRESLAATGGLGRGAAIRALQQPVLQAQQQASDASFQIQQDAARRDIARQQQAIETIFNTGQGAALQRLGIDKDTANVLLEAGRSDILDRAFKLSGLEGDRTQGLLDITQMREVQNVAAAREKADRRARLLGTLGSVGGGVIGGVFGGGPLGASVGSSIGGQLGGLAGGANQQTDLSGTLALLAAQQRNSPQFIPRNPTEARFNTNFTTRG